MLKSWKGGITMFRYEFMVIAFVVALLLGLTFPLLGGTVVYKKLSSSGDALAHSALAGVAIGLVSGLQALYMSIVCCVISFLLIGLLRRKFGKHAEIGVVVVLSAAIAVTGILSGYASSGNFESYLFGSILLISYDELYVVIALAAISIFFFFFTYHRQMACLYSEEEAKIARVPVRLLDFLHSLLFALTVAIGAKIVGSLVVSSMLVLPTAAALLLKKGYRMTCIISVIVSLISMSSGIVLSYYLDWKPGATSVGVAVVILLFFLLYRGISRALLRHKRLNAPVSDQ